MSDLSNAISAIRFHSNLAAGEQFRALELPVERTGEAVGEALRLSDTRALRLARGVLVTASTPAQRFQEAGAMVEWARGQGSRERQVVVRALRNSGESLMLVHQVAALPRQSARAFIADYFAAGGDMGTVTVWLRLAGVELRRRRGKAPGTMGFIGDAINWTLDKITEAIEGLVDAVIRAGKSLVDVVKKVASWSVQQVANLVSALIEAGKRVAEILAAALVEGVEALKKFVKAVIEAGRDLAEALEWAVQQGIGILKDVLGALRAVAVGVGDILKWAAQQAVEIAGAVLRALEQIGQSIGQILSAAVAAAAGVLRATLRALIEIGKTLGELVVVALTRPWDIFQAVSRALTEIGRTVGELLRAAGDAVLNGARVMARALVAIGRSVLELVEFAVNQAGSMLQDVLAGILAAGKLVADVVTSIAARALSVMRKVVQALFSLGHAFYGLLYSLTGVSLQVLGKFLQAAFELGKTVAQFVGHVLGRTYRAAVKLVGAALRAGVRVAQLLAEVAGKAYFQLRKVVTAVLQAMGPLGDVLEWALSQAEGTVSVVWTQTLRAIRFAGGKLRAALDWALAKGAEALAAVVRGIRAIGEALETVYAWAKAVGIWAWHQLGRVTVILENAVVYTLVYLEKDFLPGVRDFVTGLLEAGYQIASLVADMATRTLAFVVEATRAVLEFGGTVAELLIETVRHPGDALKNLLLAVEAAGRAVGEVIRAAAELGEYYVDRVVRAYHALGRPAEQILGALLEIGVGALATAGYIFLNVFFSFRPLTAEEKRLGRLVYADTFDLDKVYVSADDISNEVIAWLNEQRNAAAFATMTLIAFDVDRGITRPTLIHELCHVWQGLFTGPFYGFEAWHAQMQPDGYNYGYFNSFNGDGGEDDLLRAKGDFEAFNREQQAQIIEHYYVRRYEERRSEPDWAPWRVFVDYVQARPA